MVRKIWPAPFETWACRCALLCIWAFPTTILAQVTSAAGNSYISGRTEIDRDGGFLIQADLDLAPSDATDWMLSLGRANAVNNTSGLATRSVEASLHHDFGAMGIELGVAWWKDPSVVTAKQAHASVDWGSDNWIFEINTSARRSGFTPFKANGVVQFRNGNSITVQGTARCQVDDFGFGLRFYANRSAWSGYVSGMKFAYAATDCKFGSPGLDALSRTRLAVFRQFAQRLSSQLAASASSRINSETAFLDYDVGLGVSYRTRRASYGLAFNHSREEFEGLNADTAIGSISRDFAANFTATFELGVADSSLAGTLPFIGLAISRRF
jgi:hypothetical protein